MHGNADITVTPFTHEVKILYTDQLVRTSARRFFTRQLGRTFFMLLGVLILGLLFNLLTGSLVWFSAVMAGATGVIVIIVIGLWVIYPRQAVTFARKLPNREVTIKFDDHGIGIINALSQSTIPWYLVDKLWKFSDGWLLIYQKRGMIYLPIDRIDQELGRWIESKIAVHRGKIDK